MVPGSTDSQVMTCSRCGASNAENANNSANQEHLGGFLSIAYFTALCGKCTQEIATLKEKAGEVPVDMPGTKLIEGVHFYVENGLMVFTELYHIAKGYCCKSGCRHCAYGYKTDI